MNTRGVGGAAEVIEDLHLQGAMAHLRYKLKRSLGQEIPPHHCQLDGVVPEPHRDRPI